MRRPGEFPATGASHAGHALTRRVRVKASKNSEGRAKDGEKDEVRLRDDLKAAARIALPDAYAPAFARWQEALKGAARLEATTAGPLAVGLGNPSPYEVGLTLHHTYGVPTLPGSALKGLALRAAWRNGVPPEAVRVLFGDTDEAGFVTFWDGWLLPGQTGPLQLDTVTVHHPDYYKDGGKWPTDFDDPNPVAFLSVRPGLRFELRLSGPPEHAAYAARLLAWGLTHLGLGGKTNAGYGGFTVEREKTAAEQKAERLAAEAAERERHAAEEAKRFEGRAHTVRQRIAGMNPGKAKAELPPLLSMAGELPPALRREVLGLLLERLQGDARTRGDKNVLKQVRRALEDGE